VSANYLVWGPEDIRKYAREQGLAGGEIEFMGRVDDRTLEGCYKSATALLLPLWDDDKSRTRIPNKLAEYLAAGRPVVTCKVGDLCDFLVDGVNAYVAEPGVEREFADRMIDILRDRAKADRIGEAGQQCCLAQLDYRAHCDDLAKFFVECIESSPHSAHGRVLKQPKSRTAAL
jgi:glycosyltransferase involved in cell wall biosynthesis